MNRQRRRLLEHRIETIAATLRRRAATGSFDGFDEQLPYLRFCTQDDLDIGARMIFTRDTGHHTSGWMKNPDYERCLHLSISPLGGRIIIPGASIPDLDREVVAMLVKGFFPNDDQKCVWYESPKSAEGRVAQVQHWRVFCDETWKPFVQRGEVYSTQFTELGWRTASQVFEEDGRMVVSTMDPT